MDNLRNKVVTLPEIVIMSWLCQGYERMMCDNNLHYQGREALDGYSVGPAGRYLYGTAKTQYAAPILAGVTVDDYGSIIVVMNTDMRKSRYYDTVKDFCLTGRSCVVRVLEFPGSDNVKDICRDFKRWYTSVCEHSILEEGAQLWLFETINVLRHHVREPLHVQFTLDDTYTFEREVEALKAIAKLRSL